MFTKSAHLYDAIYRSFKDYRAESEKVRAAIRGVHPGARTVLDVACGTGEHDLYLKDDFEVDGIDLDEGLLALAREKNPLGRTSRCVG